MSESVPTLATMAKTQKARFTRAAKALVMAVTSLKANVKSQHFFDEAIKAQDLLRERHESLVEIYTAIESKVAEAVWEETYATRAREVETTFDKGEKDTAEVIALHDKAKMDADDQLNQTMAAAGVAAGGASVAAKYKLETSFEPKPKLSSEFNASELQVWEEQWQTYFDISGLQNAGVKIQKAALVNSLSTEFRTKMDLSHAPNVAAGLDMIRKDFTQRNPKVVRRHNLFRIQQRRGESYSEMRVRMKTLLKEADITDITSDELVCHLMMAACTDGDLLQEMMKIEENDRTEAKLDETVDKYETLVAAAKGLNKVPKGEQVKRVNEETKRVICYRCQRPDHMADKCPVPATSLKCSKCKTTGRHNTHAFCKGPRPNNNNSKKVDAKEEEKKDNKTEETTGKRVVGHEGSPAGSGDESSGEEYGTGRQVIAAESKPKKVSKKKKQKRSKIEGETKEGEKDDVEKQVKVRTSSTTSASSQEAARDRVVHSSLQPNSLTLHCEQSPGHVIVPIEMNNQNITTSILQQPDVTGETDEGEKEEEEDDEEEEEESSPLPHILRPLNCKHKDCREEELEKEKMGEEDAFARLCKHHEFCTPGPGKRKFSPTPPMPVRLAMKASEMFREGKDIISCPDSGATVTILNEEVARRNKLRWKKSKVTLTSATGASMRVSGETTLFAKVRKGHIKQLRVVVSPDLADDMLVSWSDQVLLGVLHSNWPEVIPDKRCDDEEEEEEEKCNSVRTNTEDEEFPKDWPKELLAVFKDYDCCFSDILQEDMRLAEGEMDLKLLPGEKPYQTNRVQRLNYHERAATDKELEKLLQGKILRPYDPEDPVYGDSPWLFTAQWIEKSNQPGKYRLVADFKNLNSRIEKDVYHFPSSEDLWRMVKPDSKVFLAIDCLSAFNQIPCTPSTTKMLTVALPQGQYQFLTAGQGVCNSGSAWCRHSDKVLKDTPAAKGVDDLLLQAPSVQELIPQLKEVLEAAKKGGMTFSKKKVEFGDKVDFCGFQVSEKGCHPSPKKIETIKNFPSPSDESQLRSFLGCVNQFCHYHPDLSQTCKPLRELLKKGNEWRWEEMEEKQFQLVKAMMCEKMLLVAYDPDKPLRLITDASDEGVGYTLLLWHKDEECSCKAKEFSTKFKTCTCKWRVLWANSTTLKQGYKGLPAIYLEAIAIDWALRDAQFYLKGCRKPFEICTDHHALIGLSKKELPDLPEKLRGVFMNMRPYNFFMTHIPGKRNLLSDALSRSPNTMPRRWSAESTTEEMDSEFCRQVLGKQILATDTDYIWTDPLLSEIVSEAKKDPEYQILIRLLKEKKDKSHIKNKLPAEHPAKLYLPVWERLGLEEEEEGDGCIVTLDLTRICVPKGVDENGRCDGHLRRSLLDKLHTAHLGLIKSGKAAAQRYHWPFLYEEMSKRCQNCTICLQNQQMNPEEPPVEKHDLAARPMEFGGLDLYHFGGDTWLLFVDFFSGKPLIKNLGKHSSTDQVIKRLRKWFLEFGFPRKIRCDGGPELRGRFQEWCKKAGIKVEVSSAYRALSNARAENCIKNIKRLLQKTKDGDEDFAVALSEWANAPRADGPCVNDLFYNRQVRSCILPELLRDVPVAENREERRKQEIKGRAERTTRLPLPPLPRDSEVWMLDKNDQWTIPAKVVGARPSGKSYILETERGIYLRNRKYLRPKKEEKEEKEEENTVEGVSAPLTQQEASEQAAAAAPAQQQTRSYAHVASTPPRRGPQTRSKTKARHETGM